MEFVGEIDRIFPMGPLLYYCGPQRF